MTTLVPMKQPAFAAYLESAVAGYAEDNIASGRWPAEDALARSRDDFADSLPSGLATPDNYLFEIVDESTSTAVGVLWFAVVVKNGLKSAFVYDVEIKSAFQRMGYARAAFRALEPLVHSLGLQTIGLHVFKQNIGAQALYKSLGYEVTSVNMQKRLV
jgi:ribosomal protein S18 acetylase RimI-like enzyme